MMCSPQIDIRPALVPSIYCGCDLKSMFWNEEDRKKERGKK
jgi:hypothetical protein